jgi:hypothetical protein
MAVRELAAWKTSSTARASGLMRAMRSLRQALGKRELPGGPDEPRLDEQVSAPVGIDGPVAGAQRAGVDAEDDHAG